MINFLIVFIKFIILLLKFNNYFKYLVYAGSYLNIMEIKYEFSFSFNLVRVEYILGFFENNNLIVPSDLALYKNLRLICYIEILNNKKLIINSLPNIYQNRYYKCVEYCKINEKINFGIKFYKKIENEKNIEENRFYFFKETIFNYNNFLYKNDNLFNYFFINEKYKSKIKIMKDEKINKKLKF